MRTMKIFGQHATSGKNCSMVNTACKTFMCKNCSDTIFFYAGFIGYVASRWTDSPILRCLAGSSIRWHETPEHVFLSFCCWGPWHHHAVGVVDSPLLIREAIDS